MKNELCPDLYQSFQSTSRAAPAPPSLRILRFQARVLRLEFQCGAWAQRLSTIQQHSKFRQEEVAVSCHRRLATARLFKYTSRGEGG
eukprot:2813937-Rhodomonas_salina.4